MKKSVNLFFTLALLFAAFGCTNKELPVPQVTITAGTSTLNSIEFTISSTGADKVTYMVIESNEEIPSVEKILSDGNNVSPDEDTPVKTDNLEPATEYTVVAAAENEQNRSDVSTLTISTGSDLFADVKTSYVDARWYGSLTDTGSDLFCVQLSSATCDEMMMPLEGGELVRLYFITSPVADDNIILPAGTYALGKEGEYKPFTIHLENSIFAMGTNESDWMQINFESGEVIVEYDNNECRIEANMVIMDDQGSKIRAKYAGNLDIADYSDGFLHFTTDQNEVMTGMTGAVFSSGVVEELDNYTITLYNCPLDEDGFIVGAGYVFNCELYAKSVPYEEYDFSGTYVANPDWDQSIYPENTYITGFVTEMYGMKMPVGTYLSEYNDYGELIAAGLVQDGNIVVSRGDGKCKIDAELTTDKNITVTISYDGPDVPLANFKSMVGKRNTMDNEDSKQLNRGWKSLKR